jgi:hypothetical protein
MEIAALDPFPEYIPVALSGFCESLDQLYVHSRRFLSEAVRRIPNQIGPKHLTRIIDTVRIALLHHNDPYDRGMSGGLNIIVDCLVLLAERNTSMKGCCHHLLTRIAQLDLGHDDSETVNAAIERTQ